MDDLKEVLEKMALIQNEIDLKRVDLEALREIAKEHLLEDEELNPQKQFNKEGIEGDVKYELVSGIKITFDRSKMPIEFRGLIKSRTNYSLDKVKFNKLSSDDREKLISMGLVTIERKEPTLKVSYVGKE